jgi:hypothetical protein
LLLWLPICWKKELDDTVLCHFDPIGGIFDKLPGAGELHSVVFGFYVT